MTERNKLECGVAHCITLLQNIDEWRQGCATLLIGYARVSRQEQDTQAHITVLKAAGCKKILQEKASGGRWDRLELHRLPEQLRHNDTVVVWKLD